MKKLYSVGFQKLFEYAGSTYSVVSTIIRVSTTSIVVVCIDQETKNLVQLDANLDVEEVLNDGSIN
ncbi:MAG: hypothetical protein RLZZ577_1206 [Bacteroidota bacterium]|jgi:hypothetical protein